MANAQSRPATRGEEIITFRHVSISETLILYSETCNNNNNNGLCAFSHAESLFFLEFFFSVGAARNQRRLWAAGMYFIYVPAPSIFAYT